MVAEGWAETGAGTILPIDAAEAGDVAVTATRPAPAASVRTTVRRAVARRAACRRRRAAPDGTGPDGEDRDGKERLIGVPRRRKRLNF
ncbi:hypothetical protein Skr01_55820 [Sphaerisporangium krabiense]|nr:hypothetical protein Skr01_55820 [Sphaerisporangium krabiense]